MWILKNPQIDVIHQTLQNLWFQKQIEKKKDQNWKWQKSKIVISKWFKNVINFPMEYYSLIHTLFSLKGYFCLNAICLINKQAKKSGQLQECPCCYDDEVLEEDMDTCSADTKHKVCITCIRR